MRSKRNNERKIVERPSMTIFKRIYKEHELRIQGAKSMTENRMKPTLRVDPYALRQVLDSMERRVKDNMAVFMNIAGMTFVEGKVETYHSRPISMSPNYMQGELQKIKMIEFENKLIGKALENIKPTFTTMDSILKSREKRRRQKFILPENLLEDCSPAQLHLPKKRIYQKTLLRPTVYLDLKIKDAFDLGRISIQLHTEAAPQVVADFVRAFKKQDMEKIRIIRAFWNLWLEGEIVLDANALSRRPIHVDRASLNFHKPGVLSFGTEYLDGFTKGFLNFSISFRRLQVPEKNRIAFGRICDGIKMLHVLQEFSTKSGNLKRRIQVSRCGLIHEIE